MKATYDFDGCTITLDNIETVKTTEYNDHHYAHMFTVDNKHYYKAFTSVKELESFIKEFNLIVTKDPIEELSEDEQMKNWY